MKRSGSELCEDVSSCRKVEEIPAVRGTRGGGGVREKIFYFEGRGSTSLLFAIFFYFIYLAPCVPAFPFFSLSRSFVLFLFPRCRVARVSRRPSTPVPTTVCLAHGFKRKTFLRPSSSRSHSISLHPLGTKRGLRVSREVGRAEETGLGGTGQPDAVGRKSRAVSTLLCKAYGR